MNRRFGPYTIWRVGALLSFGAFIGAALAAESDGDGWIVAMWMMVLYLLLLLVDWLARKYGDNDGAGDGDAG